MIFELLILLATIVAVLISVMAYRNGVNDGYGYAREPWNPGYQKAGTYLREEMSHRWPELKNSDQDNDGRNAPIYRNL